MFSSLGHFKEIQCPEYPLCTLPKCFFAHNDSSSPQKRDAAPKRASAPHRLESGEKRDEAEVPRKRRRMSDNPTDLDSPKITPGISRHSVADHNPTQPHHTATTAGKNNDRDGLPATASRPISPPLPKGTRANRGRQVPTQATGKISTPMTHNGNAVTSTRKVAKKKTISAGGLEESLNPRMLPNPPASHPIRLKLIKMLLEQLARLNEEIERSQDPSSKDLILSKQDLITEALDEEEVMAKKSPAVYLNVIKSKIMVLKKMKGEAWKELRKQKLQSAKTDTTVRDQASAITVIETGLTSSEEIAFLSRLVASPRDRRMYSYVLAAPTEKELEQAKKGVEAALGWEQCDRCQMRFQVFPGRREEDGALTSGGKCTYHWAKPRRPDKVKGETKARDAMYACCNESLGQSSGCTKADSHVFKISDPKRLALVMPFEQTPNQGNHNTFGGVSFDCEMGYTALGLELIRLTALSWPDEQELLDVLVRPKGEILDLNSRYSGVWPEDYARAIPYNANVPEPSAAAPPTLRLAESPEAARGLLFKFLHPSTPLIGHALENDLNATRILHPTIVDTCILFPHPRGAPVRWGLKALMKWHLHRDIQMGGEQGHDPREDARSAGELVRFKIGQSWKKMKGEGWTISDNDFRAPIPASSLLAALARDKAKENNEGSSLGAKM
ncbi:MAG: hypothetical protein LQ351_000366 [Letrouitia transgressa]|nr:MAG: hypothetical protein LQ351_000366 [Letrouitia transgressa]